MPTRFHALVCDIDEPSRKLIRYYLERENISVLEAASIKELQSISLDGISVLLLDSRFSSGSGVSTLREIMTRAPHCRVIVSSASASIRECAKFLKEGAFWYLQKPFDQDELRERVVEALHQDHDTAAPEALPTRSGIVGASGVMTEVLTRAEKVAAIDATVLLGGESGTGKSIFARFIHDHGRRKTGPFIEVSCAAIPRDLLESELFGHEKGAFTGAISSRVGAIELAEGGTLFLDEVGDLPLDLQPKLLLFLQNRVYRRVGGARELKANVRIIAATHLDLVSMRKGGRFRDDLYYRLSVVSLSLPPLRERREDIPQISHEILRRISLERNSPLCSLSKDALVVLQQYDWPGNIRELENELQRATAFVDGTVIHAQDLECSQSSVPPTAERGFDTSLTVQHPETAIVTLAGRTLGEIEREALLQTLEACSWNKTMAAAQLGISIKSIYNKMERLGVSEPSEDGKSTTPQ